MASTLDSLPQRSLTGKYAGSGPISRNVYTFVDDVDAQVQGIHDIQKEESAEDYELWRGSMVQSNKDAAEYAAALRGVSSNKSLLQPNKQASSAASGAKGDILKQPSKHLPSFVTRKTGESEMGQDSMAETMAAAVAAGKQAAESIAAKKLAAMRRKNQFAQRQQQASLDKRKAAILEARAKEEALLPPAFGSSSDRQTATSSMARGPGDEERAPLPRRKRQADFRDDDDSRDASDDEGRLRARQRRDPRDLQGRSMEDFLERRKDRGDTWDPNLSEADRRKAQEDRTREGGPSWDGKMKLGTARISQDESVSKLGWDKIGNMVRDSGQCSGGRLGKQLRVGKPKAKKKAKAKPKKKAKKKKESSSSSSSSTSSESSSEKKRKKKEKKARKNQDKNLDPNAASFIIDSDSDLEIVEMGDEDKKDKKDKKAKKKEKKDKKDNGPLLAAAVMQSAAPIQLARLPVMQTAKDEVASLKVPLPANDTAGAATTQTAPKVAAPAFKPVEERPDI